MDYIQVITIKDKNSSHVFFQVFRSLWISIGFIIPILFFFRALSIRIIWKISQKKRIKKRKTRLDKFLEKYFTSEKQIILYMLPIMVCISIFCGFIPDSLRTGNFYFDYWLEYIDEWSIYICVTHIFKVFWICSAGLITKNYPKYFGISYEVGWMIIINWLSLLNFDIYLEFVGNKGESNLCSIFGNNEWIYLVRLIALQYATLFHFALNSVKAFP